MRKKHSYDPEAEAGKKYIAYENEEVFAKSDIPLHATGGIICMTKEGIWADFDPYAEPLDVTHDGKTRYTIAVKEYGDEVLRAEVDVYKPRSTAKRAVLIVQEHGKECQTEIIDELTAEGYAVFVPDYCKARVDSMTTFPSWLTYGEHGLENGHLTRVMPTAKETCQYLYTLIIRRTITFIEKEFGIDGPAIMGIRDGVEYAMQAAGIDKRVRALACICAAGYKEFLNESVYSGAELEVTPEKLAWLTGVSGVSYIKGRNIPLFVAIGSNDTLSDVDRTYFLSVLNGGDNFRMYVCNGYSDNINKDCFGTVKKWLRLTFLDASLPALPTINVKPNSDGSIYTEVTADALSPIRSAVVYYAFDDINHETRNWSKAVCETIGKGEYIANLPIPHEDARLFCYAHVTYENDVTISGFIKMTDFTGKRITVTQEVSDAELYSYGSLKKAFNEYNEQPVLFTENLVGFVIPVGLKGIVNKTGQMILFVGDVTQSIDAKKVLQVDCYSEEKPFELVLCLTDEASVKYYATKTVYTDSTFDGALFKCFDFKDEHYRPLTSWHNVKRLTVCTKNVVISKLLFV